MNDHKRASDTTKDTAVVQFDLFRKMDISAKAEMTFQLSENMRAVTEAGVRQRHPDYDDQMVNKAVIKLMIGEKLFGEVFGGLEVEV